MAKHQTSRYAMSMHVRASGDRYHHHLSSARSSISRDIKAVSTAIHHNLETFERVPCDVRQERIEKEGRRIKKKKRKKKAREKNLQTCFEKERKKKKGQPDQGQPRRRSVIP